MAVKQKGLRTAPRFGAIIAVVVLVACGVSAVVELNSAVAFANTVAATTAQEFASEARAYARVGVPMSVYGETLQNDPQHVLEIHAVSNEGVVYPAYRTQDSWTRMLTQTLRSMIFFNIRPAIATVPGGHIVVISKPVVVFRSLFPLLPWSIFVALCAGLIAWRFAHRLVRSASSSIDALGDSLGGIARGDIAPVSPIDAFDTNIVAAFARCNEALAAISSLLGSQRKASARMQQFTGEAGHQLRTPITILLGYLDVISRGAVTEPGAVSVILEKMRAEARAMRTMINDLIYLAKLDESAEPSRQLIDIVSLVREGAESVGIHGAVLDDEPAAFVLGHRNELLDAVRNIFDNARKHGDEPIHAEVRTSAEAVVVRIKDRGNGIDEGELQRVFDRFFRGSNTDGVEGNGLGLAIAKRAIERSDGSIRITSEPGDGTTVTLELPRVDASTN